MSMARILTGQGRLSVILFCLCACILGICGYRLLRRPTGPLFAKEEPRPLLNPSGRLSAVVLKLGQAMDLPVPQCRGTDQGHVIRDGQGQIWVLLAQMESFQFSRRIDGEFSPLEPMPTAVRDWGAEKSAVALTDGGLPIVFWETFGHPGTVLVVSSQWSPNGWSAPVTLDSMPTPGLIRSFEALRDSSGRVHLVYDRRLNPPERYKKRLIVIDGVDVFCPGKAFHVCLDKGSWSRAASTTGPGRFDFEKLNLSLDHDGALCLSGLVRQMKDPSPTRFVARQFWRNGRWSDLKSLTPTSELSGCYVHCDLLGLTHIWSSPDCFSWRYQQLSNGQLREMPLPCLTEWPRITTFPDGRIALLSDGKLTVWNGQEWCAPIDVDADRMTVASSGSILLWTWAEKAFRIQEVLVEDAPEPAPEAK